MCLIRTLFTSNTTNTWRWYVNHDEMSILKTQKPLSLKHPQSGEAIGILYKGAVLKNVDLHEMLGDIGNNYTYKLTIELQHPYIIGCSYSLQRMSSLLNLIHKGA